jgi:hypothetical protein
MPRLRFMLTALCGLAAACHAQTLVRMLPVARLAPGEQIVLGDVATVEGPGAEALRVVALWSKEDATARPNRLSPEQVREVLDKGGQNMGRIAVSGGATRVETYVAASAIAAPLSQEPSSVIRSGPSIRSAIPAAIGSHLGVDERDLQLTFDETDAALLNVATTNRTYTIAPLGRSDRQPLHVRVYEGDRLVVAKTVRVGTLAPPHHQCGGPCGRAGAGEQSQDQRRQGDRGSRDHRTTRGAQGRDRRGGLSQRGRCGAGPDASQERRKGW